MSNVKFDMPEWVNWLARDRNGALFGYREKPMKCSTVFGASEAYTAGKPNLRFITSDPNHYPQVKWSDEEPKPFKDGITLLNPDELDEIHFYPSEEVSSGKSELDTNQAITALQNFGRYFNELLEPVEEELEVGSVKFDIPEWVNWLARDENGSIYGYRNKPRKHISSWSIGTVCVDTNTWFVGNNPNNYPQVKWSDEEPTPLKDGITLTDTEADDLTDEKGEKITIEDALRWGFKTVNQIREGEPDMVNTPPHYKQYSFEPIDIITEVVKEYPPEIGFHIGTTLKYLFRGPFKGKQEEDINKAAYYLARAIKALTDE